MLERSAAFPILDARKTGNDIIYRLPAGHDLQQRQPVDIVIDWQRRYRLMRLHFAAEIVLELMYRALPGVEKIGAHIAADKARVDFAWPENITSLLLHVQERVDAIIAADRPIISDFSDRAAGCRFWEIPDFARVPCGGTHLRRSGEIGAVTLKRCNLGKAKERIEVLLRDDCRE